MNVAYNMDCLDGMKQLPDKSVDLTVTSPPYDNLRAYNGYSFDWHKTIKELYRVTKDGGVVVWVVNDQTVDGSESGTSFRQALYAMECGFNLHDTMIYRKINYVPLTHNRYEQCFEFMFVLSKGKPKTFNPIMIDCVGAGKIESYGKMRRRSLDKSQAMRTPDLTTYKATGEKKIHPNVFEYSCGTGEKTGHPAVFPFALARDHIISWSNEGDTILDPFLGSGTTRIAAYDLRRNFIGYEISKEYFDKQEERFARHTAQLNLFIDGVEGGETETTRKHLRHGC